MNAFRIGITIPMVASEKFDLKEIVPIFHKWIQGQLLAGHLLIDVADYMHVENGPGVVLVSHEANIGLERKNGQFSLTYLRKRPFGKAFQDRTAIVLQSALAAATLLQKDLSGAAFPTDHLQLRIVDKLNAPNNEDTLRQLLADLQSVFGKIFERSVRVDHHPDPLKHFEVMVETGSSANIADLMPRASVAAAT
jgi:hypothetical protein